MHDRSMLYVQSMDNLWPTYANTYRCMPGDVEHAYMVRIWLTKHVGCMFSLYIIVWQHPKFNISCIFLTPP